MNIYRTEFFAKCPNNDLRIKYHLTVQTERMIRVEDIVGFTETLTSGFHESFADKLHAEFGGEQRLQAHHHGVDIETVRKDA